MLALTNLNNRPHDFFALRTKIVTSPFPDLPIQQVPELDPPCTCSTDLHALTVLADNTGDPYRNDYTTNVFERVFSSQSFTFYLDKYENAWIEKEVLDQNSGMGSFLDYGTYSNQNLTGFIIQWANVLDTYGPGVYRMRNAISGYGGFSWFSELYCLNTFHKHRADKTTRFEWTVTGNRNSITKKGVETDYGSIKIPFQKRVQGTFGREFDERERTEYKNDDKSISLGRVQVRPKYLFTSGLVTWRTHYDLAYNAFLSDDLKVTDYCLNNDNDTFKNVPVIHDSNYAPDYYIYNRHSKVEVIFREKIDNTGSAIC